MRTTLFLLIGFPLLQVSSLGEDNEVKADHKSSPLPPAPHYWDANSWEKGAAISFWRACPKNKSVNTSTVIESMNHAQSRKTGRKHPSPSKGG